MGSFYVNRRCYQGRSNETVIRLIPKRVFRLLRPSWVSVPTVIGVLLCGCSPQSNDMWSIAVVHGSHYQDPVTQTGVWVVFQASGTDAQKGTRSSPGGAVEGEPVERSVTGEVRASRSDSVER